MRKKIFRPLTFNTVEDNSILQKLILAFMAGVLWVQQLKSLPAMEEILLLFVLAVVLAFFSCWRLMFAVIGLLWASVFAISAMEQRLPAQLEGRELIIEGYIAGLPQQDERKIRFDFAITAGHDRLPGKIRLSWYYPDQRVTAGQVWRFKVKLKRPHGLFNAHGFDYERWLLTEKIGATGYIRSSTRPVLLADSVRSDLAINSWRQAIADKLSRYFNDKDNLALAKALVIGERSDLSFHQWLIFRNTGTVHLMAISGLHIGLIAGLVYFIALRLWARTGILHYSPHTIAAGCSVIVAIFYAALAGFSIPTRRALIMLMVAMLGIILQRHIRPLHALVLALFAVMLFDPFAVLSVGFWLSFMAVILIIYALSGRLSQAGYWQTVIKINTLTAVGLAPLLLFFFQQISVISPLANFIAVPIISLLVVPLLLLAVLLMWAIPWLAGYVFKLVDWILQGLWWLLSTLSGLPLSVFSNAQCSLFAVLISIVAVLVLWAPKGIPGRYLGFIMLLPVIFVPSEQLKQGELKLSLLDVGQGLAIVVQTAKHSLIYDTGAKFSNHYDMGKAVLLPFLTGEGISFIDRMVISHGDNDHIGGAQTVLQNTAVKSVYTSAPDKLKDYQPVLCQTGQQWQWDNVEFNMLSPDLDSQVSGNDQSCVLKITAPTGSVLLTGDIEKTSEHRLVNINKDELAANILIAPHHGSKTSSSTAFLKQVAPDWVLIPAGYQNRFGFPHKIVLTRYRALKIPWLNLADSGAITVYFKAEGMSIYQQRKLSGRYWNDIPG